LLSKTIHSFKRELSSQNFSFQTATFGLKKHVGSIRRPVA